MMRYHVKINTSLHNTPLLGVLVLRPTPPSLNHSESNVPATQFHTKSLNFTRPFNKFLQTRRGGVVNERQNCNLNGKIDFPILISSFLSLIRGFVTFIVINTIEICPIFRIKIKMNIYG